MHPILGCYQCPLIVCVRYAFLLKSFGNQWNSENHSSGFQLDIQQWPKASGVELAQRTTPQHPESRFCDVRKRTVVNLAETFNLHWSLVAGRPMVSRYGHFHFQDRKRIDSEANRSITGVVFFNLHPKTPTESQLISSTVIRRRFIGFFCARVNKQKMQLRQSNKTDLKIKEGIFINTSLELKLITKNKPFERSTK